MSQPQLWIQIPCYNEAESLPETLASIPRIIPGVGSVKILVVDDGSTDETVARAWRHGADFVLPLRSHPGLARAFMAGVTQCLELGADLIVNLDADNQYCGTSIVDLLKPLLEGRAEIVLGARDFGASSHCTPSRRVLQRLGSWAMSRLCRAPIPDAATGFRAFSRRAAARMHIFTKYTYTLEMLVHAAHRGEKVVSVPIQTNPTRRSSRLFRHPVSYLARNAGALVRLVFLYNPLRVMGWMGALLFTIAFGMLACCANASNTGTCAALGFTAFFLGLLLDQISINRRLLENLHVQLFELDERGGRSGRDSRLSPGAVPLAEASPALIFSRRGRERV